jgi:hypothetical protein
MPNSASTLCPQDAPRYSAAGFAYSLFPINYLRCFEIFGAQGRNRTTDTAIFRLIFREHNQDDRKSELSNQTTEINELT